MAAIASTNFLLLKKNKTGLFAAHSVRDMKLRAPTATSRRRTNSPASFSHPSLESRQQPHRSSRNGAEQHDRPGHACLISRSRSNGFPPSTIKHQKFRPPTATPPLPRSHPSTVDPNESSPRMAIMQSHGSARLKSEIDYLQHKLKRHGETSKSVRIQDGRDLNSMSCGALAHSVSCRLPSASTIQTVDRIHKRFSSAATHQTVNTLLTMPTINDASTQTLPVAAKPVIATAPAITEPDGDHQSNRAENRPTYAYRIPQQSNVGSESVFTSDASTFSGVRTTGNRFDRSQHESKSVTCPFYMIYLTNLTMHQAQPVDTGAPSNEYHLPVSTARRVPANSRTDAAIPARQSSIHRNHSHENHTCATAQSSAFLRHNRLSTAMDSEHASKLTEILRTTPWNHVKV